ncbi:MAG: cytochrome c [Rhodoferax sp.]|nr:cytochrome c [Rhodoferax sp.]
MSEPEIRSQQQRENPEPEEGKNPMPLFVVALTAVLFVFGMVYIARTTLNQPSTWGDGRTVADLQGPAPAAVGATVDGAAVFSTRCAACHQTTGLGLAGVFPPLAGSEWAIGKEHTLAAIVLHGINGKLTVKGNTYTGAMPAFKDQLPDAEIAAVLTHIRSTWGNQADAVTADTIGQVRQDTAAQGGPYDGDAGLAALK